MTNSGALDDKYLKPSRSPGCRSSCFSDKYARAVLSTCRLNARESGSLWVRGKVPQRNSEKFSKSCIICSVIPWNTGWVRTEFWDHGLWSSSTHTQTCKYMHIYRYKYKCMLNTYLYIWYPPRYLCFSLIALSSHIAVYNFDHCWFHYIWICCIPRLLDGILPANTNKYQPTTRKYHYYWYNIYCTYLYLAMILPISTKCHTVDKHNIAKCHSSWQLISFWQ